MYKTHLPKLKVPYWKSVNPKAFMKTNEERLWSLWHVRGTVHRHLMGEPNRLSAL
jgi:hypothetical protein